MGIMIAGLRQEARETFRRPIAQIGDPYSERSQAGKTKLVIWVTRKDARRVIDAWDLECVVLKTHAREKEHRPEFLAVLPDACRYLRRRLEEEFALTHPQDLLAIEATPTGLRVLLLFCVKDRPFLDDAVIRIVPVLDRWEAALAAANRADDDLDHAEGAEAQEGV